MKKQIGMVLSVLLTLSLLLTACGKPVGQSAGSPTPLEPKDSSQQTEGKKLLIGLSDNLKEVPYDGEATPDALIAALAEETGWNLTLAKTVSDGPYKNSLSVAFAEGSAIYTAPPENQKDDYHVFDAEDLIYTVLNSTTQTLLENLPVDSVCFTAPDGGNLDFENGGCTFYLTTLYPWNESAVRDTNQPLPEDSFGLAIFDPINETCAGFENINLFFNREGVQAGTGTVTMYDGDGKIFFQGDMANADQMDITNPSETDLAYANWKSGTKIVIWLGQSMKAGEHYTVQFDAGAFACGELKSKEIGEGEWEFSCLDYGFGASNFPGKTKVKLGESVTQEIFLGTSVERAVITIDNADMGTVSPGELTEDGVITFTPDKVGACEYTVKFYLKDGSIKEIGMISDVVE